MVQRKELFRKLANFKPPKVGAPENRKGGAIRGLKVLKN